MRFDQVLAETHDKNWNDIFPTKPAHHQRFEGNKKNKGNHQMNNDYDGLLWQVVRMS